MSVVHQAMENGVSQRVVADNSWGSIRAYSNRESGLCVSNAWKSRSRVFLGD